MYQALLVLFFSATLSGCGLFLDPDPPRGDGLDSGVGSDSQTDSGAGDAVVMDAVLPPEPPPPIDCTALSDGEVCGTEPRQICEQGACIASRCGDGLLDPAVEVCDDGNGIPNDGCEIDCNESCLANSDCDDGNMCNGAEQCTETGCIRGLALDYGALCSSGGMDGRCEEDFCLTDLCQDGRLDPGEQCDDENSVPGDGCEPDCTYTCAGDSDCPSPIDAACDVPACEPSNTCSTVTLPATTDCWLDEDGDGWGGPLLVPTCTPTCLAGTSPTNSDCDDTDIHVHPFSATSRSPFWEVPRMSGGFDYDCNGVEEKRSERRYYACRSSAFGRCSGSGWMGAPPECGLSGTFVVCRDRGGILGCSDFSAETVMSCR